MTESSELSAINELFKEEDHIVYLLANWHECYSLLLNALEASPEVPALAIVTDCLLHEEGKMKSHSAESSQKGAWTTSVKKGLNTTSVVSLVDSKRIVKNMLRPRVNA